MQNHALRSIFFLATVSLGITATSAHARADETRPLPPVLENQEMRIITVSLEPGQSSQPHRHDAHVFVYVLEGTIEMQVRGGELTRLGPGETFYEDPESVHTVSRNASDTEPAKFVVHMLKKVGAPVTVPVPVPVAR